jgi:hypothetical protein
MKQIFLLVDGILTYLVSAATADGKKVYVTNRKKIVGFENRESLG